MSFALDQYLIQMDRVFHGYIFLAFFLVDRKTAQSRRTLVHADKQSPITFKKPEFRWIEIVHLTRVTPRQGLMALGRNATGHSSLRGGRS